LAVELDEALPGTGLMRPQPLQETRPDRSVRVAPRGPGVGSNVRVFHGRNRLERKGDGKAILSRRQALMLAAGSPHGQEKSAAPPYREKLVKDRRVVSGEGIRPGQDGHGNQTSGRSFPHATLTFSNLWSQGKHDAAE